MSNDPEGAAREWARGAVSDGQDREIREVKDQLNSIVEILTDVLIRVGTMEAQLESENDGQVRPS